MMVTETMQPSTVSSITGSLVEEFVNRGIHCAQVQVFLQAEKLNEAELHQLIVLLVSQSSAAPNQIRILNETR